MQRRLVADTEMLLLCNSLQQSQKALECIEQTEAWLNNCDVIPKFPRLFIEFLLAKAEALLHANQVSLPVHMSASSAVSTVKNSVSVNAFVSCSSALALLMTLTSVTSYVVEFPHMTMNI